MVRVDDDDKVVWIITPSNEFIKEHATISKGMEMTMDGGYMFTEEHWTFPPPSYFKARGLPVPRYFNGTFRTTFIPGEALESDSSAAI